MKRNQKRIYPIMEIDCEMTNVFFLPILCEIFDTAGMTINVVTSEATVPCRLGQTPAAPASPPKRW